MLDDLLRVAGPLSEHCADPSYASFDGYSARDGYAGARLALLELRPVQLVDELRSAGLRSSSCLRASVAEEWTVPAGSSDAPPILVCNAHQVAAGNCKERLLLERAPHKLIEGMLIAARAIGASRSFILVSAAFSRAEAQLEAALREAQARGVLGERCLGSGFPHEIAVVRGAGAYLSSEPTGLLETLEGKRALPRSPSAAATEIFGAAACVKEVETLCHLPDIVLRGAEWFRTRGTRESPGTTLFSVSGHVVQPGLYELPLGTPLDAIIFEHAGGVPEGRKVKAVIPGGISSPVLPASGLDVAMTEEALRERGSRLGSGAVIVMDESTCMLRVAKVTSEFFRDESCGQCSSCREGTGWVDRIVERIENGAATAGDVSLLGELAQKFERQAICGFGDAAMWPLQGLLRHFRADFDEHIRLRVCPFEASFEL